MSEGQLPTPPPTNTASSSSLARRRALNLSEESQTVPQIRIDTTDPYRSGAPSPLPPLPLESHVISATSPLLAQYELVRPRIVSKLTGADIGAFTLLFISRFVLGEEPISSDATILILMSRDDQRDNLTIAVNEALGVLYEADWTHDIRIEAEDPRAHRYFFVATVSDEFLQTTWRSLKRGIIAILGLNDGNWCSLTVLNHGHRESESEPVVVIGVPLRTSSEWKSEKRTTILDFLEKARLQIGVVFTRESFLSAGNSIEPVLRPLTDFAGPVEIGSSLGMEDNSDTLGGYFTIKNQKGQRKVVGVTNHHVVFSAKTVMEARKLGRSELEQLGVTYPNEFPWEVQSPSLADKDARLSNYDSSVTWCQKDIDEYGENLQHAIWSGKDTSYLEAKLAQTTRHHGDHIRNKHELQDRTDISFAKIFATSGRGQFGVRDGDGIRKAMDWALLDCLPERLGTNALPPSERFNKLEIAALKAGSVIKEATSLGFDDEAPYFAYTRSGHKVGRFSKVGVMERLKADPELYEALIFVGDKNGEFMRLGDTGCWILNRRGQLTALGFAASPESNYGYPIPIGDVYKDIQQKLGVTIEDPELLDGKY